MPSLTSKNTLHKWKFKAIERNKIIRQQRKRLLELEQSRDGWKLRFKTLQNSLTLKDKTTTDLSPKNQSAQGHSYPLFLVLFCVQFLNYGAQSFRGCVHSLVCINLCFRLGFRKLPSHTTIRNWSCKMGYYRVHKVVEKSEELWLILIDESISLGNEKILLVLGMPLSKVIFDKALQVADLRVLAMEISKTWTGETIAVVLEKVSKHYPIGYIISDCGNNLKKSYELGSYLHIPDITHTMANILASLYEKDAIFSAFCKECKLLRQHWVLSKQSKFMPPSMRNKLRFANVFGLILWAKDKLEKWETLPTEVQKELSFLQENKAFFEEFYAIQSQSLTLQKLFKVQGYSAENHKKVVELLAKNEQKDGAKQAIFKQKTKEYLDVLAAKKPKELAKIHCSSDSIESAFGKLKQKINPKSNRQMTVFVLTLSCIGSAYSEKEVKKALETVKEKDLKNYRKNPPE
ncbi:MAG: hypothetical protein EAZ31_00005 [Cytophagia bacterium]|nr:MAG: hypothetical protein EAZ31_00005 [Cytophagia bacterium]